MGIIDSIGRCGTEMHSIYVDRYVYEHIIMGREHSQRGHTMHDICIRVTNRAFRVMFDTPNCIIYIDRKTVDAFKAEGLHHIMK